MNIAEIKYERLSEPERFLLDIFYILVEYEHVNYPDRVFYKKSDQVMFIYDSKYQILLYSYEYIHVVFRDKFNLINQETNKLVQSMVEKYLKLKVDITTILNSSSNALVEEHLKLKVITTLKK